MICNLGDPMSLRHPVFISPASVFTYTYMYIYIHIHIYVHIYTCIHIYACIHMHIYTYIYKRIYTHIYTHICLYTHTNTYYYWSILIPVHHARIPIYQRTTDTFIRLLLEISSKKSWAHCSTVYYYLLIFITIYLVTIVTIFDVVLLFSLHCWRALQKCVGLAAALSTTNHYCSSRSTMTKHPKKVPIIRRLIEMRSTTNHYLLLFLTRASPYNTKHRFFLLESPSTESCARCSTTPWYLVLFKCNKKKKKPVYVDR